MRAIGHGGQMRRLAPGERGAALLSDFRLAKNCRLGVSLGLLALAGLVTPQAAHARGRTIITAHPHATATPMPPPIAPEAGAAEDDAAPAPAPAAAGEVLDNAAVLRLARAGLGEPAVAALIRSTRGHYDISTPALIALAKAGVPSGAIAAMIKVQRGAEAAVVNPEAPDPAQPHPAGVYVLARWLAPEKMLAIKPVTTTRTTSGSLLGYAYAGGLIPVSYRAILPQPHAAMLAGESRPTFYFFTGGATGSQHLATVWGAAPNPDDVSLVRFVTTRNGREVKIGSFTVRGAKLGVDEREALPFAASEVAPGVLAVQPEVALAPGEYGFIQTVGGVGVGAAQASTSSARVFDFAVADAPMVSAGIVSRESAHGKADQVQGSNAPVIVRYDAGYIGRSGTTKPPAAKKLPNSAPSLYPK